MPFAAGSHAVHHRYVADMRCAIAMLLVSSAAAAEHAPGDALVAAGIVIDTDRFANGALTLEGALRLPVQPLWVHASGAWGGTVDLFEGSGPFRRGMAGLELEGPCRTEYENPAMWSCLLLGLDAGYESSHVNFRDDVTDYTDAGPVIVARLGLSGVYHHLAIRGDFHFVEHREHGPVDAGWQYGLGVALAVGYRR
jgi:hypothetical protein